MIFITDDTCMHGPLDPVRMAEDDLTLLRQVHERGGEVVTSKQAIARFGSMAAQATPPDLGELLLIPDDQPPGSYRVQGASDLDDLHQRARMTFARHFACTAPDLTPDRAARVRTWRVDEGCTWRRVAQRFHDLFAAEWEPPSNQLAGMAVCHLAAAVLGEHYRRSPWN